MLRLKPRPTKTGSKWLPSTIRSFSKPGTETNSVFERKQGHSSTGQGLHTGYTWPTSNPLPHTIQCPDGGTCESSDHRRAAQDCRLWRFPRTGGKPGTGTDHRDRVGAKPFH